MERVQLEVITLAEGVSQSNSFSVLLQEKHGKKRFVIVIGFTEAQAIAISLDDHPRPGRPLTHDLFHNLCKSFNISLLEIEITDLKEGVFYANLVCKKGDIILDIDSRSSDALALALKFKCPIFIKKALLEKVSIEEKNDPNQTIEEFEEELEEELRELENLDIETLQEEAKKGFQKNTLKELAEMLNDAIKNEDYEMAAILRDEIDKRQ